MLVRITLDLIDNLGVSYVDNCTLLVDCISVQLQIYFVALEHIGRQL